MFIYLAQIYRDKKLDQVSFEYIGMLNNILLTSMEANNTCLTITGNDCLYLVPRIEHINRIKANK